MSTGIETVDIIDPWLYATLSGDAQLVELVGQNIGGPLLVGDVAPPYVTWSEPSVRDVTAQDGGRIWVDTIYTVKGVAATASWDDVAPIARRIDALLHGERGVEHTSAAGHITSVREGVVQYGEQADGQQYRHLGGRFRIRAHSLPALAD